MVRADEKFRAQKGVEVAQLKWRPDAALNHARDQPRTPDTTIYGDPVPEDVRLKEWDRAQVRG